MKVTQLTLTQFRNHNSSRFTTTLEGSPARLVLLSGENGAGKTSVLEALHLLATGIGIKARKDAEFTRFGTEGYRVEVHLDTGATLAMRYKAGESRVASVDGHPLARWSDILGKLRVTLLKPEDLVIIEGAPEVRRRFLDVMICQADRGYFEALRRYRRAYKQKNSFEVRRNARVALPFETLMEAEMPTIFASRASACDKLQEFANGILSKMGDGRRLELTYRPAIPKGTTRDDWGFAARRCTEESARMESLGAPGIFGPGRDEIVIALDGVKLRHLGSQGQKRFVSLVLKLAEASWLSREGGDALILVDDVFGELDVNRKSALLELLAGWKKQVWIADTDTKSYEERWSQWLKFDIKDGTAEPTPRSTKPE